MLRKERYRHKPLTAYRRIVWCLILSAEPQGISVSIPPLEELDMSEFCSDNLHHPLKRLCRCAVGEFPVQSLHPRNQTAEQTRSPFDHSKAHMPHMPGKVVGRRSFGQCIVQGKQAWPEKPAVAHHHRRQDREGATGTLRVEAHKPLYSQRHRHDRTAKMEPLAAVEAVPAAMRESAGGAHDQARKNHTLHRTNAYIHSGGWYVPFLLLRKFCQRGK